MSRPKSQIARALLITNPECTSISIHKPQAGFSFKRCVDGSFDRVSSVISNIAPVDMADLHSKADLHAQDIKPLLDHLTDDLPAGGELDVFVLYHIGHVVLDDDGEPYLLNSRADYEDPSKHGVPMSRLQAMIKQVPARTRIVVLDCCDGARGLTGMEDRPDITATDLSRGLIELGCNGIVAAPSGLAAYAPKDANETAFSKVFCDVLSEGSGESGSQFDFDAFCLRLQDVLDDRGLDPAKTFSGAGSVE